MIVQKDATSGIQADIVIADPPYNMGIKYEGYRDNLEPHVYLGWTEDWIRGVDAKTLWIVQGDKFAAETCVIAKRLGWTLRNWCIWHYDFGVYMDEKFVPSHTHCLYFVRDGWFWNPIYIKSKRQELGDKRASPQGRVRGDVWSIPRVCGNHPNRVQWHPCQLPLELVCRMILHTCPPGGLVGDLFAGSGIVGVACKIHGFRYLGYDTCARYVELANARIADQT